jgi:hypothetical protein
MQEIQIFPTAPEASPLKKRFIRLQTTPKTPPLTVGASLLAMAADQL